MRTPNLTRYAWLSIAAAVATIALKTIAYALTGSVGLFSDAIESIVNLVGAVMALSMLTVASRPADEDHSYGHSKAEYFSSGVEGTLILIAALSIAVAAGRRLLAPQPLEQIGVGRRTGAVIDVYPAPRGPVEIPLRRARIARRWPAALSRGGPPRSATLEDAP